MRRVIYPVLTLVIVLLVATGLFVFRQSWLPEVTARIGGTAATDSRGGADRTSPFVKAAKDNAVKHSTAVDRPMPQQEPVVSEPAGQPATQVSYPFPEASEVLAGTQKTAILATFGPPEVMVTGADFGRLNQKFVYRDKSTGRKTIISVVNGNVASAQTYAQ